MAIIVQVICKVETHLIVTGAKSKVIGMRKDDIRPLVGQSQQTLMGVVYTRTISEIIELIFNFHD